MDDQFVDLVGLLERIANQSGADQQKLNEFISFSKDSILYKVENNGKFIELTENLSGLGLFLPRSKQDLDKYRYLQVFSDLKLTELFDAVLAN